MVPQHFPGEAHFQLTLEITKDKVSTFSHRGLIDGVRSPLEPRGLLEAGLLSQLQGLGLRDGRRVHVVDGLLTVLSRSG